MSVHPPSPGSSVFSAPTRRPLTIGSGRLGYDDVDFAAAPVAVPGWAVVDLTSTVAAGRICVMGVTPGPQGSPISDVPDGLDLDPATDRFVAELDRSVAVAPGAVEDDLGGAGEAVDRQPREPQRDRVRPAGQLRTGHPRVLGRPGIESLLGGDRRPGPTLRGSRVAGAGDPWPAGDPADGDPANVDLVVGPAATVSRRDMDLAADRSAAPVTTAADRSVSAAASGRVGVRARTLPKGFTSAAAAAVAHWCADASLPGLRPFLFSVTGGVGVSTVTAALGGLLSTLSHDPVLAVELSSRPWAGLSRRVASEPRNLPAAVWQQHRGQFGDAVSAVRSAPAGPSGLHVLGHASGVHRVLLTDLPPQVAVLTDAGSLDADPGIPALLAAGLGPAVLVARADSAGVDAALVALTQLRTQLPPQVSVDPLLVLVDAGGYGRVTVRAAAQLASSVTTAISIPQSAALRSVPIRIDRLEKPLAAAIADLASAVADRTYRSGPAGAAAAFADSSDFPAPESGSTAIRQEESA